MVCTTYTLASYIIFSTSHYFCHLMVRLCLVILVQIGCTEVPGPAIQLSRFCQPIRSRETQDPLRTTTDSLLYEYPLTNQVAGHNQTNQSANKSLQDFQPTRSWETASLNNQVMGGGHLAGFLTNEVWGDNQPDLIRSCDS